MRAIVPLIALATLLILAGCGVAEAPAQPLASAPTQAAAQPTAPPPTLAPTAPPPTLAPTAPPAPTEETLMPTEPPPPPDEKPTAPPPPPDEKPTAPPLTPRPTFRASPIPQKPATPPVLASPPTPALDPALASQVASAKADLSGRQSVPVDQIGLVEVRSVVWPDGSMGCPRPGMVYPQVQVEGLLIRLSIGDRVFEYHSGGNKPPFLCERPQP